MCDQLTTPPNSQWQRLLPWLQLLHVPGIGPVTLNKLLETFGSPDKVLSASMTGLRECLSERQARAVLSGTSNTLVRKSLEQDKAWLEACASHHILTLDDPAYPALLREIYDPPALLYLSGNKEILAHPQVAVVGTRLPTAPGKHSACLLAEELARSGICVTSGMARGIDGYAHRGALKAMTEDGNAGLTVGVLACGVDVVYPLRHKKLAEQIVGAGGALISEFPLGTQPKTGHFPRRNRIISGLSMGIVVVEAALRSGSLVTARCALEQGREVFAMPGSVNNLQAQGCHALIRDGAGLVENASQVLEELNFASNREREVQLSVKAQPKCERQKQILDAIGFETCHPDELILRTGFSWPKVTELLTLLELDGYVKTVPGGIARVF